MKLSDVMSSMGLSFYAELALLLFVGVFVGVLVQVLSGGKRHEAMRFLPLDDDGPRRLPAKGRS